MTPLPAHLFETFRESIVWSDIVLLTQCFYISLPRLPLLDCPKIQLYDWLWPAGPVGENCVCPVCSSVSELLLSIAL